MNKLLVTVLLLGSAKAVFGQESLQAAPVRFTTTFAFHMGDKVMPAGEYQIRWIGQSGVLVLRSDASAAMTLAMNGVTQPHATSEKAAVVFMKYSDTAFFLSTVYLGHGETGFQTVKTRKEKQIVTTIITAESKPETIFILAERR